MSLEEVEASDPPPPVSDKRRHLKTQKSSIWTRRQQAVCVRRAFKSYGTKKNPNLILDGLNMTVPKGNIYGLLGASGCGKTTLLNCIVGRRRLDAGEIWVLGGKPGTKGSGVPGPRIGYMPQEVALYGEFTIRETMVYFGWIAGKTTPWVKEKIDFVVKLLQLPDMYKFVKNLSGGQQRRVSFAAALIHDPELMILDEPTVGLDPLLRQNIWDYLVKIAHDGNKTIIITTHYIDETRQAHMIGLMRGGRFLAEESPDSLMAKHGCDSLEDVFLTLSKIQNQGKRRRSSFMQEVLGPTVDDPAAIDMTSEISGEFGDSVSNRSFRMSSAANDEGHAMDLPPQEDVAWTCLDYIRVITPHRMKALLWKNALWMWRNVPVMLFVILLPVVQIVLFCLTIGQDPRGLHLAVFNQELNNTHDPCIAHTGCEREMLSCRYLKHLKNRTLILDNYGDSASALDAVKRGHVWGMLQFNANYSEALYQRIDKGREASPMVLENSDIKIALDMSNQHIGQLLRRDIFFSFQSFAQEFLDSCNYSVRLAGSPTSFKPPIYGPEIPNFTDFAAPGVILTIIFFLAVALTSGAMLIERNDGMLERMLVSGITGSEILCSHVISQFMIMFGQSMMVIVFSFYVFSVTCEGSVLSVLVLTALTGLCGMCFGFVVSSLCDTERTATYLALGSFLPIVMLCGVVWPIEGMHYMLKYLSYFLPLTQSTESLRSIMARGWGLDNPTVYYGYLSTLMWIMIFLCASILILKFKKG